MPGVCPPCTTGGVPTLRVDPEALSADAALERLQKGELKLDAVVDSQGSSYLHHFAGSEATLEVVQALIEANLDPSITNNMGCTPLHVAAASGSMPVIRCLVEAGAQRHAVDSFGMTPLGVAEAFGHPEAVLGALEVPGGNEGSND